MRKDEARSSHKTGSSADKREGEDETLSVAVDDDGATCRVAEADIARRYRG